jgi:anti-anti-sigma regulatory factor
MGIESGEKNIVLVELSALPEMSDQLDRLAEEVGKGAHPDVVIDFSGVDIITTPAIKKLLIIRKLLVDCGHRLVLCGLAANTKGVFTVTGLDRVFEFADDKSAVLGRTNR